MTHTHTHAWYCWQRRNRVPVTIPVLMVLADNDSIAAQQEPLLDMCGSLHSVAPWHSQMWEAR